MIIKIPELAWLDILKQDPHSDAATRALVSLYLNQENWTALERRLAEAKQAFPSSNYYPLMEYQMWRARKDTDKALETWKRSRGNSMRRTPKSFGPTSTDCGGAEV